MVIFLHLIVAVGDAHDSGAHGEVQVTRNVEGVEDADVDVG
jgi:hypothetical protein